MTSATVNLSPKTIVTNGQTDAWVKASWLEFMELTEDPNFAYAKFYFDHDLMRMEMTPIGPNHAHEDAIVSKSIGVMTGLKRIPIYEYSNCSYRKQGIAEFQPDLSFYIGSNLKLPPRNDTAVDLDQFDLPTLVIEIAATSIQDDLGYKRLLYEKIGIPEYWVVNARTSEVFAFAIADGRSGRITHSQVLAGLDLAIIETALQRSRLEDDAAIFCWLLEVFSNPI
jgi:Uma2 family endonuclease